MAALTFPSVLECAAVGVPSRFSNDDDVKICIVTKDPPSFDCAGLIAHLSERLPHYMVPQYVELLNELPRTPTNKVRKSELRNAGVTSTTWDRRKAGIRLREIKPRSPG